MKIEDRILRLEKALVVLTKKMYGSDVWNHKCLNRNGYCSGENPCDNREFLSNEGYLLTEIRESLPEGWDE